MKKFNFDSPKLFIFCLGGKIDKCHIEVHDVVFLVAKTDQEACEKLQKKWIGTQRSLHIDSWLMVDELEGYRVLLVQTPPTQSSNHLYFVNLGYYQEGVFGESHFMTLVIATSKTEAIAKATQQCFQDVDMLHSDNVYDVDDCIRLDEVDHFFVDLAPSNIQNKKIMPINGYQRLLTH